MLNKTKIIIVQNNIIMIYFAILYIICTFALYIICTFAAANLWPLPDIYR